MFPKNHHYIPSADPEHPLGNLGRKAADLCRVRTHDLAGRGSGTSDGV